VLEKTHRSLLQNIVFFYRALLQKRPMFLGSLLIVATLAMWHVTSQCVLKKTHRSLLQNIVFFYRALWQKRPMFYCDVAMRVENVSTSSCDHTPRMGWLRLVGSLKT